MKKTFANNDKKKIEIRIKYGKGIATSTEVYTHAEPADLVEDLGVFVEREYEVVDKRTEWRYNRLFAPLARRKTRQGYRLD